jgi:hypothetical protein
MDFGPFIIEAIKQGGLVAVIAVIAIFTYYMYKLYVSEKKDHQSVRAEYTAAVSKMAVDHAAAIDKIHKEHEQREDQKITDHIERYEKALIEKNARIAKLEDQNEAVERRYADGLAKFLIETIEARNGFSRALEEHRREMKALIEEAMQ